MAKRKQPISAKQKKLYLQEKRAAKRGDPPVHPEASAALAHKTRYKPGTSNSTRQQPSRPEKGLISKFSGLSQAYINASKTTSLTRPLPRPLPEGSATFPVELIEASRGKRGMTLPRRPKWRYEMSKKEVEMNEEGVFKKWLSGCDEVIAEWREEGEEIESKKKEIEKRRLKGEEIPEEEQMGTDEEGFDWPRSTVFFERNLQVWRQLWRTTEMSSILLVLIDIRCPPLHFPPSLQEYISSLQPRKEVILVLTKCDLIPANVKDAWVKWCKHEWEEKKGWEVVEVESYRREARKQGTKAALKSHLPPASLSALLSALQRAHTKLLTPPNAVSSDPTKLANWKPRVRSDVDWDALRRGEGGDAPVVDARQLEEEEDGERFARDNEGEDDAAANRGDAKRTSEQEAEWERKRLEFLTVGLIGQPNVGKSSLLNALVGSSKVRASKTPGKTKHFQTIFWSPQIRLCDTPGLVLPSLTPYELQAISSILPISHIPALPSVLRLAGCLMPLERVLGLLKQVDEEEAERERRKTFRAGAEREGKKVEKVESWTTGEIMEGWADDRGFVTAKAGRPDLNRAGNHILRAIAESRISWSFLPPALSADPLPDNAAPAQTPSPSEIIPTSQGIWLGERAKVVYESSEEEESSELDSTEDEESDSEEEAEEGNEDEPEEETKEAGGTKAVSGMFGALAIEGGESEDGDESEEEQSEEDSEEEQSA